MNPAMRSQLLAATFALAAVLRLAPSAPAQDSTNTTTAATLHPALFLVGDSIMSTGTGTGESGPWGWGHEFIPLFDASKIHIYNEGHGGRSSRSYIDEGLWAKVRERIRPGDFVILHFGHNDSANSRNYPDRISARGSGDETQEMDAPATGKKEIIHTYGWYLHQYIKDARAGGATIIICSPPPRNQWSDGKIIRGFDGYARWAADAAESGGAPFIDLNTIAANRYDALGQESAARCFADGQHPAKVGARLLAESVVEGLKQLKDCPLAGCLLSPAPAVKPAP
jgi:rhamnogalacturonan acetylesterase